LSNNSGFSEHPQIAAYRNNVYAIWADDTSGNRDVLFTKSEDNSTSFEKIKNISNTTSDSFNQEIAVFGDNIYIVWLDQDADNNTNILLKASSDGGQHLAGRYVLAATLTKKRSQRWRHTEIMFT
jgi:hypothetical protein